MRNGDLPVVDAKIKLAPESLETSNVSLAASMADMITLSREFEMNIKAMETAKENDEVATRVLALN